MEVFKWFLHLKKQEFLAFYKDYKIAFNIAMQCIAVFIICFIVFPILKKPVGRLEYISMTVSGLLVSAFIIAVIHVVFKPILMFFLENIRKAKVLAAASKREYYCGSCHETVKIKIKTRVGDYVIRCAKCDQPLINENYRRQND
jgi:hypothetical protein